MANVSALMANVSALMANVSALMANVSALMASERMLSCEEVIGASLRAVIHELGACPLAHCNTRANLSLFTILASYEYYCKEFFMASIVY